MIVNVWVVDELEDGSFRAREHRGGSDGMGRKVDQWTGAEIKGTLSEVEVALDGKGFKPIPDRQPSDGAHSIWRER